jgi:hypothetical protein
MDILPSKGEMPRDLPWFEPQPNHTQNLIIRFVARTDLINAATTDDRLESSHAVALLHYLLNTTDEAGEPSLPYDDLQVIAQHVRASFPKFGGQGLEEAQDIVSSIENMDVSIGAEVFLKKLNSLGPSATAD